MKKKVDQVSALGLETLSKTNSKTSSITSLREGASLLHWKMVEGHQIQQQLHVISQSFKLRAGSTGEERPV